MVRKQSTVRYIFRARPCDAMPEQKHVAIRLNWESDITEVFEGFKAYLLAVGWDTDQIERAVSEWAEEIQYRNASAKDAPID